LEWERHQKTDYNRFVIDSEGTILASTMRHSGFVDNIIGFNVREILHTKEYFKFMRSLQAALKSGAIIMVDYQLGTSEFIAAIDPIDSDTAFLHEHSLAGCQDRSRVISILMKWVKKSA